MLRRAAEAENKLQQRRKALGAHTPEGKKGDLGLCTSVVSLRLEVSGD
jgi:hypothetical protein